MRASSTNCIKPSTSKGGRHHEVAKIGLAVIHRAGLSGRHSNCRFRPNCRAARASDSRADRGPAFSAAAQARQSDARLDAVVLAAIRSNPVTAPYPISTSMQKGKVVLSGIVGTKQVHDAAVRMVIDMGVPVRDDLVIDTGAAAAVAHAAGAAVGGYGGAMPGTLSNSSPYIYPPPLFGRLDDPFFGYVPPLVSFPPWWRRQGQSSATVQPRQDPAARPQQTSATPVDSSRPSANPKGTWQPLEVDPVIGHVEVNIDALGGYSCAESWPASKPHAKSKTRCGQFPA